MDRHPAVARVDSVSSGKDVLTTGQVARLCRVTIRTVIKWFETGRLEGYKLPGSRERRFTRAAVLRFMRENDMPVQELLEDGGPRRVLVVDDDEAVRRMILRYLATLGQYEVESAASGWEAGLRTAAFKPHVLLLDYRLGDTTGLEVVKTIRAMTELHQPSILLMSAWLEPEQAEEVLAAGADAFLPKPFELEALRDLLLAKTGASS